MSLWRTIRVSLRSLRGHLLRSCLTMLGVIIGVAAVIAIVALGEGTHRQVTSSISGMGSNLLVVRPGTSFHGPGQEAAVKDLTLADIEAIRAGIGGIAAVVPEVSGQAPVTYFAKHVRAPIVGAWPEHALVRNLKVARGRFIRAEDDAGEAMVAVVGPDTAKELFGGEDPLGARIKVKGLAFTVVGVLESKGNGDWMSPDDQVILPYSVASRRVLGQPTLNAIAISAASTEAMPQVQKDLQSLFRARHRIAKGEDDDFFIRNLQEIQDTMSTVTRSFTFLLGGIAAVSLLVGGIGIMNIMLVSVTERTREIGIRKALGATRADLLIQFLVEAMVLSIIGGAIGIVAGYGIARLLGMFGGLETVVPLNAVFLSVAVCAGVGIAFGIWPAAQAARLDPIEALRYE